MSKPEHTITIDMAPGSITLNEVIDRLTAETDRLAIETDHYERIRRTEIASRVLAGIVVNEGAAHPDAPRALVHDVHRAFAYADALLAAAVEDAPPCTPAALPPGPPRLPELTDD